jgi:hypothetical protein
MGSKLYDFLTESFLFDDSLIEEQFASMPEEEIRKELSHYREYWFANAAQIEQEVRSNDSALKLFSGLKRTDLRLLKQTALYVDQQILTDPLFDLGREPNPDEDAFNAVFGLRSPGFDKGEVQKAVRYSKALTPMVAGDYVKFFPTSRFFEPLQEIPLTYSKTGFAERVPKELHEFFHSNAHVTSAKAEGDSIAFGWPLELGRAIAVTFKDHPVVEGGQVFFLAEQEIESVDRENRTADIALYMPGTLPTPARFNSWVTQSINQSAGHVYRRLCVELALADGFGANYLSNSDFTFKLIGQIAPVEDQDAASPVNALLNVELPILEKLDTETLMKVRRDEGEAFAEFRLEWDRQVTALRGISDPEELRRRTEEVIRELTEVQVSKVDRAVAGLKKQLFIDLIISTGTFAGAIQAGGFGILGAAMAALQGYRSYAQYQNAKRANPAFFLWKASKGRNAHQYA